VTGNILRWDTAFVVTKWHWCKSQCIGMIKTRSHSAAAVHISNAHASNSSTWHVAALKRVTRFFSLA